MKLTKIKFSLFKVGKNVDTMYWNLWSQFGISQGSSSNLKVKNFYWSETAKKDFYSFPLHKKLLTQIKQRGLLEEWETLCEPLTTN